MSGGGSPSGPLSFLRVYDAIASVVKSGGKTRRAAKMNTLKVWHPDIKEFIEAKPTEEKKAWALIEQGYDGASTARPTAPSPSRTKTSACA
jgi:ribonucleoside-diphosphate reductase alpha chain